MKDILQKTIAILFSIGVVFFIQTVAIAQTANSTSADNLVEMTASPQTANAGDSVTLQLSSQVINLTASKITWYVDDVAGQEGTGDSSLTITAKAAGQSTAVKAIVETTDGTTTQASITITPAGVDLIVEPTSYVPPFYKGKAIFTTQGTARVVAIPDVILNGSQASSKDLIFEWQQDGSNLSSESGLGDDSIIVNGTVPINDIDVSVTVLDPSGNTLAASSKILSASDPQALVYEDNPLYGILFNKAIVGNYYLGQNSELDLIAKPYFFNLSSDSGSDSTYKWSVNGNYVSPSGQSNELILQQPTGGNLSGTASISLTVNNNVRIFQYTDTSFNVNFGI